MIAGMGPLELMLILGIALLIFGPKNLPKLGRSLGQTVKNVREGMEGDDEPKAEKAIAEEAKDEPVTEAAPVAEAVEDEGDVKFCTHCGAKNAADAAFCSKCGEKLA